MPIKFGNIEIRPHGFESVYLGANAVYCAAVNALKNGNLPSIITNAWNAKAKSLIQYGRADKIGSIIRCNNGKLQYEDGEIKTVGEPEVLKVNGKNLFNEDSSDDYIIQVSPSGWGYELAHDEHAKSVIVQASEGLYYTLSNLNRLYGNNKILLAVLDSQLFVMDAKMANEGEKAVTLNFSSGVYLLASFYNWESVSEAQLEVGKKRSRYEPYKEQTASVVNLYSCKGVKDTQDIVTGEVVRRNNICVFDGTQEIGERYLGVKENGNILVYPREKEYSGKSISFVADKERKFYSLSAITEPIQDLHGYDYPWGTGSGINKLPPNETDGTQTLNGITVTAENGVYTLSGEASAETRIIFPLKNTVVLDPTKYKICFLNDFHSDKVSLTFRRDNSNIFSFSMSPDDNKVSQNWTNKTNNSVDSLQIYFGKGMKFDGYKTISPVLMNKSSTNVTDFYPYSNICPITRLPSVSLNVRGVGHELQSFYYNFESLDELLVGVKVDFAIGVRTNYKQLLRVTDTSAAWRGYGSPTKCFYSNNSVLGGFKREEGKQLISNKYPYNGLIDNLKDANSFGFYCYGQRIAIVDSRYSTVSDFKQSLIDEPLYVCGEHTFPNDFSFGEKSGKLGFGKTGYMALGYDGYRLENISTFKGRNDITSDTNGEIFAAVSEDPVVEHVQPKTIYFNKKKNYISETIDADGVFSDISTSYLAYSN